MSFSERYGYALKKILQFESMDDDLRNSLENVLIEIFEYFKFEYFKKDSKIFPQLIRFIWTDFFKYSWQMHHYDNAHREIMKSFKKLSWERVYDLLESIAFFLMEFRPSYGEKFKKNCNYILERENSAWRFLGDYIAPIIDSYQITFIEDTLRSNKKDDPASMHFEKAISLLSQRNYRNSMNEAISAVEAQAQKISGLKNDTLSKIIKTKKLPLLPALQTALNNLYGYASDNGIRHARKEGSKDFTLAEAQFMLIQCSSYINLLRAQSENFSE